MSDKSKMNIILPFFHINVPQTKSYGETNMPNEIKLSENKEEKRREESIISRGGAANYSG